MAAGAFSLVGQFESPSFSVGGMPISHSAGGGPPHDTFAVTFDVAAGSPLVTSTAVIGGFGEQVDPSVATDGSITYVGGHFTDDIDLPGDHPSFSVPAGRGYLAEFPGNLGSSFPIYLDGGDGGDAGGTPYVAVSSVALSPHDGTLWVGGWFTGTLRYSKNSEQWTTTGASADVQSGFVLHISSPQDAAVVHEPYVFESVGAGMSAVLDIATYPDTTGAVVGGTFTHNMNFPSGDPVGTNAQLSNGWLARLSGSTSDEVWGVAFATDVDEGIKAVAIDGARRIVASGWFKGGAYVSPGSRPVDQQGSLQSSFVVEVADNTTYDEQQAYALGTTTTTNTRVVDIEDVAIDPQGDIAFVGFFDSTDWEFGSIKINSNGSETDGTYGFIVRQTSVGQYGGVWHIDSPGDRSVVSSVAVDGCGRILAAGTIGADSTLFAGENQQVETLFNHGTADGFAVLLGP